MRRLRPAGPPPTQTTSYISSFVVEYERRHWLRAGREQLLQTKFEVVIRPRAPAIVACGIIARSKSPHNINWWLKVDEARALEVGRCYALQCKFHPNSVRTMHGGTMTGLRWHLRHMWQGHASLSLSTGRAEDAPLVCIIVATDNGSRGSVSGARTRSTTIISSLPTIL